MIVGTRTDDGVVTSRYVVDNDYADSLFAFMEKESGGPPTQPYKFRVKVVLRATHVRVFGKMVELDEPTGMPAGDYSLNIDSDGDFTITVHQVPEAEVLPPRSFVEDADGH